MTKNAGLCRVCWKWIKRFATGMLVVAFGMFAFTVLSTLIVSTGVAVTGGSQITYIKSRLEHVEETIWPERGRMIFTVNEENDNCMDLRPGCANPAWEIQQGKCD